MVGSILNIVFLLSLSLWVGSVFFFSFFGAPTLFRELPRELAGDVVGKIFSQYFMLGYATLSLSFLSLLLRGILEKPFPWVRLVLILLMLGCTLYIGIKIQPKAHMFKTVVRTLEEGPDKEQKQAQFARLHKTSVILNSVVLLTGLIVVGITAVKMNP